MEPYDDILDLPHPDPATRRRMPRQSRAAQFAPFAALTGHNAAVSETARLTQRRIELDEGELAVLDRQWRCLKGHLAEHPTVTVTYFQPDQQKDGGAYLTVTGCLQGFNEAQGMLYLSSDIAIPLQSIYALDSPLWTE